MAELAELAASRSYLPAMFAGTEVGMHEGELDDESRVLAAQLCIKTGAGADTTQIPRWIDDARRRARQIAAIRQAGFPERA